MSCIYSYIGIYSYSLSVCLSPVKVRLHGRIEMHVCAVHIYLPDPDISWTFTFPTFFLATKAAALTFDNFYGSAASPSLHPVLPLFSSFLYWHLFPRPRLRDMEECLSSPASPGGARPLNDIWLILGLKSASGESNFSAVDETIFIRAKRSDGENRKTEAYLRVSSTQPM